MASPQPRALRTDAEIDAAAVRRAAELGPVTQEQADHAAALLGHWLPRKPARAA